MMFTTDWSKMDVQQRISVARRSLITRQFLWWSSIALKMKPVPMTAHLMAKIGITTCAVDGTHFFYNSEFIESLSKEDLVYIFAHEVMHLANLHHTRIGHRNPQKWNIAADFVINQQLIDAGLPMPQNSGILNSRYVNSKYKGWSTERVYADLPDPKEDEDNNDPGRTGGVVSPRDENGDRKSQQETEHMEQQAAADVAAATKMAKDAGAMPGSFEELFPDPVQPQGDWRQVLPRFLTQHAGTPHDLTWAKPARKFVAMGVYLPSMELENEIEIAIVMDTSGSMGRPEFAAAVAETNEILAIIRPKKVHFIQCDMAIQEYKCLENGEELRGTIKGRGGTSFVPPFEYLRENGIAPHCLIYFTDGYGDWPREAPKYPVLVACTTDQGGPEWAETMRVEL